MVIGSLYLIIFSSPKWLEEKNKLYFRLLSIIPIVYIIVSFIFRILYNLGIINLSEFVSPIFVGPKLLVFGFFIAFFLYVKYKEKKYKIFDENNNMIPIVFSTISTKIFGIFGLTELPYFEKKNDFFLEQKFGAIYFHNQDNNIFNFYKINV